MNNSTDH